MICGNRSQNSGYLCRTGSSWKGKNNHFFTLGFTACFQMMPFTLILLAFPTFLLLTFYIIENFEAI